MTTNTRPIVSLDFDQLKQELITFIKTNPTFSDYNFEGSALNAVADILAYNTHTNAYYGNMVHNESFLDTAQKRASVVSRAKELGYTPRSCVCSTAYVNLNAYGTNSTAPVALTRGTEFISSNDNGTYSFIVADTVVSTVNGLVQNFSSVKLVNGNLLSNYFVVDPNTNIRSIFSIPAKTVDISTLKVRVRDSLSSVDFIEYFLAENVYELKADSKVYFLQESYDGFFQIYFGENIIGKQPVAGNVIDIDYITTTQFDLPNGCRTFTFNGSISNSTSIDIITTQVAFAGSDKEDIDSIKYNAVKSNSAKNRAVTADDFSLLLKEKFNFIKAASVWGGEDNVPPVYGKVFISLQPTSGFTVSDQIKLDVITPVIKKYATMTVIPEFVDPVYTEMEFTTKVKFNQFKTVTTTNVMESLVRNTISDYIDSISTFGGDYLEANLISILRQIDPGIMSVSISKRVGYKLSPIIGTQTNFKRSVNNPVALNSIQSSKFNVLTDKVYLVSIKEIIGKQETATDAFGNKTAIQYLGLFTDDGIMVKEIGFVNINTGDFDITFSVYSYITTTRFVSLRCGVTDSDIITKRNQILSLGVGIEDSVIGMVSNNTVVTELYGK